MDKYPDSYGGINRILCRRRVLSGTAGIDAGLTAVDLVHRSGKGSDYSRNEPMKIVEKDLSVFTVRIAGKTAGTCVFPTSMQTFRPSRPFGRGKSSI
jgi:hypothetical protein